MHLVILEVPSRGALQDGATTTARIVDGRAFSIGPFRAERLIRKPLRAGGRLSSTLVLGVRLTHEPG